MCAFIASLDVGSRYKYFLRSEKKSELHFLALFKLKITWKLFNLSTLIFWENAISCLNSIFWLFSKLKCGQNRLKIWVLAYSYDREISELHFLYNLCFNLNSFNPLFKGFSERTAFSQKMDLLKIIAHFWTILN